MVFWETLGRVLFGLATSQTRRSPNRILRILVIIALLTALGWPVAMVILALIPFIPQGLLAFAAIVIPLVALLIVLLAYPVITAAVGIPLGKKGLRVLRVALGIEFLVGTYLVLVPVRNDPGLFIILALATVTLLFLAPGTLKSLRRMMAVALVSVIVVGTLSFFSGGREGLSEAMAESTGPEVVEVEQGLYEIRLQGENNWSEPFQMSECSVIRWKGPASTKLLWSDGEAGLIRDEWSKLGSVRFSGPVGGSVYIRVIDPGCTSTP